MIEHIAVGVLGTFAAIQGYNNWRQRRELDRIWASIDRMMRADLARPGNGFPRTRKD